MKGIEKGPYTADGTLTFDVQAYATNRWSVYHFGSPGGGTINVHAGKIDAVEQMFFLFDNDGTYTEFDFGNLGHYRFIVACDRIDFVLSGSTDPANRIILFPEYRW